MRPRNCSSSNPRVYIGCQSTPGSRARCLLVPSLHAKPPLPTPPAGSNDTGTSTTPSALLLHPFPEFCPRPQAGRFQPGLLSCPNANHSPGVAQKLPRRGRDERVVGKRKGKMIAQDFGEVLPGPDPPNPAWGQRRDFVCPGPAWSPVCGDTASKPPEFSEPAQAAVGGTAALSSLLNVIIPIL